MPAPKGNKFWEARSSHGRSPIFEDPDVLWAAAVEYFEWVVKTPLKEEKVFHFQGKITRAQVSKMRAMTLAGLCNYLGIGTSTFDDYRIKEGFSGVTSRIDQVMRQQKFEGAAAEMLNPNIIARDLGLAEKKDHQSSDGSMTPKTVIITSDMTPQEAAEAYAATLGSDE